MKIISWNVNGVRAAHKKGFLKFLNESNADIVCLQETKAHPEQLDEELKQPKHSKGTWYSYWSSAEKKGYSGTAIYSKIQLKTSLMNVKEFDCEGRVLVAKLADFTLINAYFPNSQEKGKRLDYKLAFCKSMLTLCNKITKKKGNLILCGDYNIAHKPIDLARPKQNEENPGYLPEERAWMDTFTSQGYIDTFRHTCKEPQHYTWWSYRANARANNVGWRIDYFCTNTYTIDKIKSSTILPDVLGSDHCPIQIVVKK